ncbi:MAG: TonB-dependent receptor [Deltaproteobacteria bacterium]|nr:TonB-dependent receptor [Deltaproteobacteria bacterium]
MRTRLVVALSLVAGVASAQPDPAQPVPEQPEPAPEPPAPAVPTGKPIIVTGKVIDALGKPIRGAVIKVEGTALLPVRTDRFGAYRIDNVPSGATLLVERDGFQLGIGTATGAVIDDIVLLTESQYSETIELRGEAPAETPGAAKLDRTELQRIPGTGGDVVRTLTAMPGVVNLQIPLGYSGVVIRGSSPQDSKVLVDDFEIPVLFHNIGFRAVIPAEAINSLDYIPGGFDVAYGRASSGIVKLTTRPGSEQRSTQAEISVIDGGLLAQGPAGKDTRYMVGFRRSTIDFVLPSVIPDSVDLSLTTVPSYYDGQFRIDHRLSSKWKASLSTVATDDTFELYATKNTDAMTKRFFNRTRFLRVTAAAQYSEGPWSAKLALSGLLQQFVFELGAFQYIRINQPQVTPRVEVTRTAAKALGLKDVVWRVGAEAAVARSNIEIALPREPREGEPMGEMDPNDTSTTFTGKIWTPDFTAWTAATASLDPRIRATVGLRAEAFTRAEQFLLQPRGELQIKLTKPLAFRLSAGAFSRPPEFQSENLQKGLKAEQSRQVIAGLQYEPREGTRVQASVYYTDRTKLITSVPSEDPTMQGRLGNDGRGTTKGAELLATYRAGPWFGWLSYSLSNSTRVDHPGDARRLFSFDQPHSLNAAISWKQGKWQFGGRFQLYSGLPSTPAIGSVFDNTRNIYIPLFGEPNSDRAPLHHQLDLRIDRSWQWGPVQMTAFLDVQNVYMNESVVAYFYGYDYTERAAFTSIPLIPSIGLRGIL